MTYVMLINKDYVNIVYMHGLLNYVSSRMSSKHGEHVIISGKLIIIDEMMNRLHSMTLYGCSHGR